MEEAILVRNETQRLLARGGFNIRKWANNSADVMETILNDLRAPSNSVLISDHETAILQSSETLGVAWSPDKDCFSFVYPTPEKITYTKRGVLSLMSKLFDPRGQLAPVTVRARVLFQETCLSGIDWDEEITGALQRQWRRWFEEFANPKTIQVEHPFKDLGVQSYPTLHTFTDASEYAYAAVSCVRHESPDGTAKVTLAMAKARPAPMKNKSIPMLELQGAVLGTRLAAEVSSALDIPECDQYFWTDSMNVLCWVRSNSRVSSKSTWATGSFKYRSCLRALSGTL